MNKKYKYLIVIFLIVFSCIAFGRIAGNDFINLDDNAYIAENYHIRNGINFESIKWIFTAVVVSNWHPLTLLSNTLDWSLFEANPSGHHLVSLLLHIGAVLFLFLFLNKTTKNIWPSAFAAALFAFHPLRVESVSWASERKDVLSMFFGMACVYAYAFYAEDSRISRYLLCLILFSLALMSKSMMVTLPFVLILLDYWPLKRWQEAMDESNKGFNSSGRLIREKVPFILLTIAFCIITFWAQNKGGSVASTDSLPFIQRSTNAIVSYAAYLGKIFWPVNLSVFYPYGHFFLLWPVIVSFLILIMITIVVIYAVKKMPFLFVGWFWYVGTLIPVIGLVQVGEQAMADRYSYLPSVGIAIMLAWGIPLLFSHEHTRKKILFPAGIASIAIMATLTWHQCGYWKNSIEIWNHALSVTKNNYLAHSNLASALAAKGKIEEALYHYKEAIRLKPDYADGYYNRGNLYARSGKYQLAIEDFNKTISLNEDYADAYYNRAFVYLNQGNNIYGCRDAKKACELGNCATLKAAAAKGICH
ncbi:MAG: tetratricopeptide repeat protein [Smithella sp.]|jgi:tetratricopeptide (TPR) repeat protein